ncbi:chemotaxis protein CheB [Sulfobacillus harzensis]|uniref:Stage 0 sporulation protein A homolog n=1 Tax=Sulfobacillus harzensis TaxID=2729629 RepID=A0A7Y0L7A7_9FIRM|nr:chemotaxis protein CheB [Sulfobacillus harzensis]NMP24343.1 response regulator [Sulfobacillus harzensis]
MSPSTPFRVVIVDDSAFFAMRLANRMTQRGWEVSARLSSGLAAVHEIPHLNPDLVVMDLVMPGMNGIATLQVLRKTWQGPIVMMSAYSDEAMRNTWLALDAGAQDFVAKPGPGQSLDDMLDHLVSYREDERPRGEPVVGRSSLCRAGVRNRKVRAVVIGASTGGPKAVSLLCAAIKETPRVPIFIVQHMPAGFTRSFAERLAGVLGSPVFEAAPDGTRMPLKTAPVVVAAGGFHLRVSATECWAEPGDRRNGVIPSVDVTLVDVATAFGAESAAVIVTGMGSDGAEGARAVRQAGGTVVVESKESALVWGMPGVVAERGDADAIWPLPEIGHWLSQVVTRNHGS